MDRGLEILAKVKRELKVPILTDVHESTQVPAAAEVAEPGRLGVSVQQHRLSLDRRVGRDLRRLPGLGRWAPEIDRVLRPFGGP